LRNGEFFRSVDRRPIYSGSIAASVIYTKPAVCAGEVFRSSLLEVWPNTRVLPASSHENIGLMHNKPT